jgi:hypothetical protein
MSEPTRILYCHCAFANVVPKTVKEEVLLRLTESGQAFDAVADLCDLSAKKDPCLQQIANGGPVRIAACYPRAVKWLFGAASAPLPEGCATVYNMRTETADTIVAGILGETPEETNGEERK